VALNCSASPNALFFTHLDKMKSQKIRFGFSPIRSEFADLRFYQKTNGNEKPQEGCSRKFQAITGAKNNISPASRPAKIAGLFLCVQVYIKYT
jgi:hypothetical protein